MTRSLAPAAALAAFAAVLASSACDSIPRRTSWNPSEERLGDVSAQQAFYHLNQALNLLDARAENKCPAAQAALELHAAESARLLSTGRAVELQSIMRRVLDLVDPVMTRQTGRIGELRLELHAVGERAGLKEDKRWPDMALRSCQEEAAKAQAPKFAPLRPLSATLGASAAVASTPTAPGGIQVSSAPIPIPSSGTATAQDEWAVAPATGPVEQVWFRSSGTATTEGDGGGGESALHLPVLGPRNP